MTTKHPTLSPTDLGRVVHSRELGGLVQDVQHVLAHPVPVRRVRTQLLVAELRPDALSVHLAVLAMGGGQVCALEAYVSCDFVHVSRVCVGIVRNVTLCVYP